MNYTIDVILPQFRYITPIDLNFTTQYGIITVPKYFLWDGMSDVPDLCLPAACLHDYIYFTAILPKDKADKLLRKIMLDYKLYISANLYYLGVVLGGHSAWQDHRNKGDSLLTIERQIYSNGKNYILDNAEWLVKNMKIKEG